ncbi:MAG: response regulator [Pseudomonadota bacterium]
MATKSAKLRRPCYVLIIEDNVHHAEILTEVLDRHFAPVVIHTVDTIEDGIEFVSLSDYHIILTGAVIRDVPVTDAIPKLTKLSQGTPIIVISGKGDEALAALLIKKGATEYLVKTKETLETLPAVIAKHMKAKKIGRKRGKAGSTPSSAHRLPSPESIIREVDKLTQQALAIVGPRRRKRRTRVQNFEDLDQLLTQIQRLREMASKLLPKE